MKKLGKWELIRKLGSGAFAEVWLASGGNRKNAPLVALKLVHAHLAADPQFKKLLQEEAWAASLLSHPNIVEIYEVSAAEGRPYLAMEFIPGQALNALLSKLSKKEEKLSVEEAAYAVNQSALGLHYAHEVTSPEGEPLGLVHRDISPHNLIASDDGRVKVVDFGLAKISSMQGVKNEEMEGKMAYMPPEQIRGDFVDRRVDTYALGAVLWELLAGQKMFMGQGTPELLQQALLQPPPDPRLVFSHLPVALADVLAKALMRDKEARFQTALQLAEALEPFITDDAAAKLAKRIQSHFEFMPRTKEEAMGMDRPAGPKRRALPPTAAAKRSGGKKKKARAVDADEGEGPVRKGRRTALLFVILLPLLALAVVATAPLAGKYLNFTLPVSSPEMTGSSEVVDDDDAGVTDEADAGTDQDAGIAKKKPVKKKARDGGS